MNSTEYLLIGGPRNGTRVSIPAECVRLCVRTEVNGWGPTPSREYVYTRRILRIGSYTPGQARLVYYLAAEGLGDEQAYNGVVDFICHRDQP